MESATDFDNFFREHNFWAEKSGPSEVRTFFKEHNFSAEKIESWRTRISEDIFSFREQNF